VARRFGVGLGTVQRWLQRAGSAPLETVDWSDRPRVPRRVQRTPDELEELILRLRAELRSESILGEYGAAAIERELQSRPELAWRVPSVRTIGRILERRGALDARRIRRPAPPPGWYLPDLARRTVELDSFDVVEGLHFQGGIPVEVLTGISLHGGLPAAWPGGVVRSGEVIEALHGHWLRFGLPGYAQFDNDPRFIGGMVHPDSIGLVIRLCLALRVVPVFAPVRESGFQASIESFNGRWQRQLWFRGWRADHAALRLDSGHWIDAARQRSAIRIESAPDRRPLSPEVEPDLRAMPHGRMVFLRRTTEQGTVSVLGRSYPVDPLWPHRLVRVDLELDHRRMRFFALRRRDPEDQPLLGELPYSPPARWAK
jgi:hypothetical protein